MTDAERDPPTPDPGLDFHVEQFVRLMEDEEEPDLETFLSTVPDELRDEVRSRCEDVLRVRDVLQREASGTHRLNVEVGHKLGQFELLRVLGRGANGVVYLAQQQTPSRKVAVKVLLASAATPRRFERFRRESQAAGRLQHPGIARILEVGHDGDVQYYAMEYVDGESLDAHLDRLKRPEEGSGSDVLSAGWAAQAAEVVMRVAEALQYAHDNGVVHRDIKPHNIMLGKDGRPRVVDFGLAKDVEETDSLTRTGDFAGTPYYMSPEQIRKKRQPIDHRTDVYSLGVVLYEMLTLRRPFHGDTVQQVFDAISTKAAPPIRKLNSRVPRDLEVICRKAMEKAPEHRYDTAGELAADLRRFVHHESIHARPPSPAALAGRYLVHRRRELVAVATAVLVTVLTMGTYQLVTSDRRAAARTEALWSTIEAQADTADARQVIRWLGELRALHEEQPGRETVSRASRTVETRGRALIAELRRQLELPDPRPSFFPEAERITSVLDLTNLLAVFEPEAAFSDDLFVPSFVQVELEGPASARLEMWVMDPLTGYPLETMDLGLLESRKYRVPCNEARLVARGADGAYAECLRVLPPFGNADAVRFVLRPTEEVVQDMVYVEPGSATFGVPEEEWPHFQRQILDVPGFWIDRYEVTIGQYQEFLDATGHEPPAYFALIDREANAGKPVIGVTWYDARAYAEWAGKRLPTMFEYDRATFGMAEGLTPWGTMLPPPDTNLMQTELRVAEPDDVIELAMNSLAALWAVDHTPNQDISHGGVVNLFGNAQEWTESAYFILAQQGPRPAYGERVFRGESFRRDRTLLPGQGLRTLWKEAATSFQPTLGFRCAKSDLR